MNPNTELSDEDIDRQLAGEAVRGPRTWRGRELAPLTRGLRALRNKAIAPEDTGEFHDVALLHILAQAHAATDAGRVEKRRALIVATDDVTGFRAAVTLLLDDCSDADIEDARRLVNDLLGLVQKAEVTLAEKKTASGDPEAPSPTTTPSPSSTPSDSSTAPPITLGGS